jgi:hydrophobic/amphiphilic exporter-1 (mainly G- bacteria), HAE1 family
MIKVFVKRPITTLMIVFIIIAFGVLSISNLKLDMLPNMNIPVALVMTSYTGASPNEMETLVSKPLEGVLGTVARVNSISSISYAGSSIVILQFEDGTNIDNAALDMREKVDLIKGLLPEDAGVPNVMKIDPNASNSFTIGVSSESLNLIELKNMVDNKLVNRLERQEGVASVDVAGGLDKEILVELSEDKLRGFNLTESQIMQALAFENRNMPIGTIKQGDKSLQLRIEGEFKSLLEIQNLPLTTPMGNVISLSTVATVSEVYKDSASISYMDGVPSVTLTLQKQSTANVVSVSDAILKEIAKIEKDYPDLKTNIILDPASFIRATISAVTSSALLGAGISVIVLILFLRNLRSTLIVSTAIPISIISTFVLMYYSNLTLNLMSLGGLALGIGMLVDNSIIVLENIYRKMEEGEDRITACVDGAKQVSLSIIASTLTTIAVFLPITFGAGIIATLFTELSLTIIYSLVSSLAVALTFVPMACSVILKPENADNQGILTVPFNAIAKVLDSIDAFYRRALVVVLKKRTTTILATIGLVILTFISLIFVPAEFIPSTDEGSLDINISMPKGTLIENTEETTNEVISIINEIPEISSISYTIGSGGGIGQNSVSTGGSDVAAITVKLGNKKDRKESTNKIATLLSDSFVNIAGADIKVSPSASSLGAFSSADISFDVYGEDLDELDAITTEIAVIIADIEGIKDVSTSMGVRTHQATIELNRIKASSYGITTATVNNILNAAVSGSVATKYKTEGTELDVRIKHNSDNLDYINDVQNILIPSPYGISIPLYEISDVTIEEKPVSIYRENRERYVTVTASLGDAKLGDVRKSIESRMKSYFLPPNYSWKFSGTAEQFADTFTSLIIALVLSIALVYMVMCAEFESFVYPFIVMFSIPIGLSGGLFGLFITGASLSIMSFLGLIMLSGIIVNNAIVLIDYINFLMREENLSAYDAILKAGPTRLRPILMTTLTTVLGLLPLLLSNASGSELLRGLASVVVFGLSLSTLVTLLLIPVIYLNFNMSKEKRIAGKLLHANK